MPVPEQLGLALADRYRIERVIGEGGMATVYLAEDIRHRRNVALKVLRPELAAVLGTERFLAEITVTANLQHPHLLPLFDSGEADGLLYYVMPYIEGETLRARLARERQLPVDEAVRIAAAVASALAYAHRHDVIHRDLKPENILLHEGQPLVTDFGIALAVSNAASGRITQTGLSLGTPQYMSPEQATGDRTIDARSDIYSLGAVTYEMLVGDPPHSAGTTQAIIAKVLTERPPGVRVYRDTVPVHVEAAIQRALAKLPADRFASAVEFAEALTGARVVTPVAWPPAVGRHDSDGLATSGGRRASRLTRALPWAVAAAAIIVAGAVALLSRSQPVATPVAFEVTFGDSVETWTPSGVSIAIARDGSRMAFTGRQRGIEGIYVRRLDGLSAELVRGTEGGTRPVLSPDGGALAFAARDGRLRKVALAGGAPITLTDQPAFDVTWSDRDELLFGFDTGLYLVPAAGGEPVLLADADTSRGHRRYRWPHALPGGRAALITIYKKNDFLLESAELGVVTVPEGEVIELGVNGTGPRYLPRERVVIFGREGGSIHAAPFSLRGLRVTGPSAAVLTNVLVKSGGAVEIAVSDNGTLIYKGGSSTSAALVSLDSAGRENWRVVLPPFVAPAISPDGRRVAFTSNTSRSDVWLHDLTLGTTSRVTANGSSQVAAWLDSLRLVYTRADGGAPYLESRHWDGTDPEPFARLSGGIAGFALGPPGGHHVFRYTSAPTADGDLWIAPADSPNAARPLIETPEDERLPRLSPDGRLLAWVSDQTGRFEVYVRPVPGPGARIQVSTGGGTEPVWMPSGRRLIYRGSGRFRTVAITTEPSFDVIDHDSLFVDHDFAPSQQAANYDVLPDGNLLVVEEAEARTSVRGIANWSPLRRR